MISCSPSNPLSGLHRTRTLLTQPCFQDSPAKRIAELLPCKPRRKGRLSERPDPPTTVAFTGRGLQFLI